MTMRKCIKRAVYSGEWFRPKSLRGAGWAYGINEHGYIVEMPQVSRPGMRGGCLWEPHCETILEKWELVDPDTVVWEENP